MTMASSPSPSISRVQASMLRLGEGVACLLLAHVVDERAAAALALGQHHLDAVPVEQPDRGLVDRGLQHRLGAARQHRDPAAAFACRRDRRRALHRGARREAGAAPVEHRGETRADDRQPPQQPAATACPSARRSSASAEALRIGQHAARAGCGAAGPPAAAHRSRRYRRGRGRRGACSARRTGRSSCRTGRRGSGRCASRPAASPACRSPACP